MTQQDDITQRVLTAEHHLNELMRLTQPWPNATIPCATVRSHVEQALSKLRAPLADERASDQTAPGRQYHILKTDPEVFQAVLSGAKTFEIRLNDRGYAVGDVLGLRETKHTGAEMRAGAPLVYTGRECQRFVSHVLTGYGLADGWCCLSFRLPHAGGESAPVADETTLQVWAERFPEISDMGRLRDAWNEARASAPVADERELRSAAQAFYDASKTVVRFAVESLDDRDALVAANVRLRAALASAPVAGADRDADERAVMTPAKAAYVEHFGHAAGWLSYKGSWFIEGFKAGQKSAPVAGEAQPVALVEVSVPHLRSISVKIIPDAPMPNVGDLLYATPQASAEPQQYTHAEVFGPMESAWNAALDQAAAVAKRISDKYAFGHYGNETDTADEIEREILALKQPQADKDDGQQRAVDVDLYGLAIECGAVISTDDLSWAFSYSAMRNFCIRVRAALSATQAEQGERDAK